MQSTNTRPGTETTLRTVLRRVLRVCKLDATVYLDIERDPHGTRQAAGIVAVVAAAAVVGTIFTGDWHAGAIAGAVLAALIHWLLWSLLVYLVATALFHGPAQRAAVVRGLGYAQAPQIIAALGFLPLVGPLIVLASRALAFLAGHHAMRHTLRANRLRVTVTTLVTFLLTFVFAALVRAAFGDITLLEGLTRP